MRKFLLVVCLAVTIFSCQTGFTQVDAKPPAAAVPGMMGEEAVKLLEPMVDKALEAYNAGDSKAFYADFAKSMAAIATDLAFKTLYTDNYMATFGKYQSKARITDRGSLNDQAPLLVYSCVFEKEKKVVVSVNFIKEEENFKLMQIQMVKEP